MNYTITAPQEIGCYAQSGGALKLIRAVKDELEADVIVNFQLFNMRTHQHSFALKVNGKVLANDGTDYWGYAWQNGDTKLTLVKRINGMDRFQNFAGSVLVAKDGKAITTPEYGANFPGVRGRTCIGRKANGDIVLYCWPDQSAGACSLRDLGQKMVNLGCIDAINYDGGGSCQMICPSGQVTSGRPVSSFFWARFKKNGAIEHSGMPEKLECPYPEPRGSVCYGSRGNDARWCQWHLNMFGAGLVVDGIFGPMSRDALLSFQRDHGLNADGICGALTKAKLKDY